MSSAESLQAILDGQPSGPESYTGPTEFEGIEINQGHSPKKFIRSFLFNLQQNGFVSANIIGMPGSGKTILATMLAHLAHTERPELNIIWAGANELRRIKEFLNALPKGIPTMVIFDDASNALDSLKGTEAAEAFEILTQGRHITQSQLAIVTIYHYSFSHKKNFRSFAANSIYTSASPTERGNILHMLRDNFAAKVKFRTFQNVYKTANDYGWFELDIGKKEKVRFVNSEPFRCFFVISLTSVHLLLCKKMACGLCSPKKHEETIDPAILYNKLKKAHGRYGRLALTLLCYAKGFKNSMPRDLREALDMASDLLSSNSTSYRDLDEYIRKERKLPLKRIYKKKNVTEQLRTEIIEESKIAIKEAEQVKEQNIAVGIDTITNNPLIERQESIDDSIEEENNEEDEFEEKEDETLE